MPKIEAVLIVLNGRTRAVQLPEPVESSALMVKVVQDGLLVEMEQKRKVDLRGLRVAKDRRTTTSRENLSKAKTILAAKRADHAVLVVGFLAKLSPVQRILIDRLFHVLGFVGEQPGTWAITLGPWVASVLELCPEPHRLDFYFLKKWLGSPYTAANATDTDLGRGKKSPTMIRRAVARNLFITAWEEQVGPVATDPSIPQVERDSNHPFHVLSNRIQHGRISLASLREMIAEYAVSGLLQGSEVAEAERMIATGKWMGVPVPGV